MSSDTSRRAVIRAFGGPDAIELEDVVLPPPGTGEVRMRSTAIGLNFIDTYHRSGLYPIELPSGLGVEAAGVVEAVGEGVNGFAVGDRVCTFGPERGSYSTVRNIAARLCSRRRTMFPMNWPLPPCSKGALSNFLSNDVPS